MHPFVNISYKVIKKTYDLVNNKLELKSEEVLSRSTGFYFNIWNDFERRISFGDDTSYNGYDRTKS